MSAICDDFMGDYKPSTTKPKMNLDARKRDVARMFREGDWSKARPGHFVALHAMLHERTYGVTWTQPSAKDLTVANGMVTRMLDRQFDGDVARMLGFIRWAWREEKKTEAWRRANGREGGVLTIKVLFGTTHVLDRYKVALSRNKRR